MSYSYQTFSVGQVLTAAQVQSLMDSVRDHQHGVAGVYDHAATQAQMEATAATTVYGTPANLKWHPGVAKAWGQITVSGGTPTLNANLNVSSITDNGVGDFTFNFTTAFSSANYAACAIAQTDTAGSPVSANHSDIYRGAAAQAAASCRIGYGDSGTGVDPTILTAAFWGDQ